MTIKKELLINFLMIIIPFSFIAGNLIINLNVLLIILFSLIFYGFRIFKNRLQIIDKVILIFFLYICANGILNDYFNESESKTVLLKSFSYLRFLILYFIIKFLIINNIINYKYLFFFLWSCLFICVFRFIDTIYF